MEKNCRKVLIMEGTLHIGEAIRRGRRDKKRTFHTFISSSRGVGSTRLTLFFIPDGFSQFYIMHQVSAGRTDKAAGTALDAVHETQFLCILRSLVFDKIRDVAGNQFHRADINAARTGDTGLLGS